MTATEEFAAFVARRDEERAGEVRVTWRRVAGRTGGGYSGLGPCGQLVWVGPPSPSPAAGAARSHEYGRLDGKRRVVVGATLSLAAAKAAAAALLDPDPSGKARNGASPDRPVLADKPKGATPMATATDDEQQAPAAAAPAAEKPAKPDFEPLFKTLLAQVKSATKGTKAVQKKTYIRVELGGKTVAYVNQPGRKGVRISVPRESGGGYDEITVAEEKQAPKAMEAVQKRVALLTAK